jgi:hypothetical protein
MKLFLLLMAIFSIMFTSCSDTNVEIECDTYETQALCEDNDCRWSMVLKGVFEDNQCNEMHETHMCLFNNFRSDDSILGSHYCKETAEGTTVVQPLGWNLVNMSNWEVCGNFETEDDFGFQYCTRTWQECETFTSTEECIENSCEIVEVFPPLFKDGVCTGFSSEKKSLCLSFYPANNLSMGDIYYRETGDSTEIYLFQSMTTVPGWLNCMDNPNDDLCNCPQNI